LGKEVGMEMPPKDQKPVPANKPENGRGFLSMLDKGVGLLSKILFWIAGVALVGMLLLIVADVIGIKIFNSPVPGGIETVAFLAAIAIGFAVAHTQVQRGHVAVEFIVERFPRRLKMVTEIFTVVLGVCLAGTVAWYSFKYGMRLRDTGQVSMTQKIPYYPFVYGIGTCFVVLFLVLVSDLAKSIAKAAKTWTLR
jgi:TRAP-type C4-dicarboxylate transport system permease small subunit